MSLGRGVVRFVTTVSQAGYPGAGLIKSVAGEASTYASPDLELRMGNSPAPLSISGTSTCQTLMLRGRN